MTRRKLIRLFALVLAYPSIIWAQRKKRRKPRKPKSGRNNSPLKAIPGVSQKIQNEQADRDGLERLKNEQHLDELKGDGRLVPLPIVPGLEIKNLDPEWRFCRPWTARFVENFGALHEKLFPNTTIFITEATRTPQKQRWLARINPNARGIDDSIHLTGAAVDITKADVSYEQVLWMRQILLSLHERIIYVVEEFQQPCFHIMVYKNYQKPANW